MQQLQDSLDLLKLKIKETPLILIVSGSGLSFSSMLDKRIDVNYSDLNLPQSTVQGHTSSFSFGYLNDNYVCVMNGRFHFYEGYSLLQTVFPIRLLCLFGIKILLTTNAAGALNPDYNVGDIAVLVDHINLPGLAGFNALIGPNLQVGPRFPAMSDAYNQDFINKAIDIGKSMNLNIHQAIYSFVAGPSFETRAESRYLRMIGADLVGMSTVPEIVAARHAGVKCCAISLITNKVDQGLESKMLASHKEVLETGVKMKAVLSEFVKVLVTEILK